MWVILDDCRCAFNSRAGCVHVFEALDKHVDIAVSIAVGRRLALLLQRSFRRIECGVCVLWSSKVGICGVDQHFCPEDHLSVFIAEFGPACQLRSTATERCATAQQHLRCKACSHAAPVATPSALQHCTQQVQTQVQTPTLMLCASQVHSTAFVESLGLRAVLCFVTRTAG